MAYKPRVGSMMSSPNVIPMADIMLVLLIIFMVVTPMIQKDVSVDMAQVANTSEMHNADREDAVVIAITHDGGYYLGTKKLDLSQIKDNVQDLIANRLDRTVYVKSDRRAKFVAVAQAVDEIRAAGVDNLGLLTDRLPQKHATGDESAGGGQ